MALDNRWIRYIDRTYSQIKDRVLTDMQILTPEITDHTESNPFVKMLSIWAGIAEMLGYYIDNAAREAHLITARLYWTGIKIARAYDYRVHSYLASTGEVTFYFNTPTTVAVVIPANTEVQNDDGIRYFTLNNAVILVGQTEVTTTVKQFIPVSTYTLGVSAGTPNQEFVIDDTVVDSSVVVKVGGLAWQGVATTGFSLPNSEVFVQSVNEEKKPIIIFGDGINGKIPPSGSLIEVSYQKTEGDNGNTGALTITQIISTITTPDTLYVKNRERTSGGSEVETLEQLKRRIPKAIRTLDRAVTRQDFIDVAELKSGVAKAGVYYSCGSPVEVYIVPDGGGIASNSLLIDTQEWINQRRIITVQTKVLPAGEIRFTLVVTLTVLPQYTRSVVVDAVRTNLANFLSFQYQEIGGQVQLSDIYEVIENTEGVRYSKIDVMKPLPYARPLAGTTNVLNWNREVLVGSNSNATWLIKLVSGGNFELFKDGNLIGIYAIGFVVGLTEIQLQILAGSYTLGDSWEFHTYPYYGTVTLDEPSLPVSLPSDITINASGGL